MTTEASSARMRIFSQPISRGSNRSKAGLLLASLVLGLTIATAAAASSVRPIDRGKPGQQSTDPKLEHDWLPPTTAMRLAKSQSITELGPCGSPAVSYTWREQPLTLGRFSGIHVEVLAPEKWFAPDAFDCVSIWRFVDRADLAYALLRELLIHEPSGNGKLPIYVVPPPPDNRYGALGCHGCKAIWLRDDYGPLHARIPRRNYLDDIVVHELLHNFDRFDFDRRYVVDPPHAWTILMEPLFTAWIREPAILPVGGEPSFATGIHLDALALGAARFSSDSAWTWERCLRDGQCPSDDPNPYLAREYWAEWTSNVFRRHGLGYVTRYWDSVRSLAAALPSGAPATEQASLHVEALSHAVGRDLSCYADTFGKWPVSPATRERLGRLLPADPSCGDDDGDGFSAFQGDCDDSDSSSRPDAAERVNGIDDNCNGSVDEAQYSEGSTDFVDETIEVPASIHGTLATDADRDRFRLRPSVDSYLLEACSTLSCSLSRALDPIELRRVYFSNPPPGVIDYRLTIRPNPPPEPPSWGTAKKVLAGSGPLTLGIDTTGSASFALQPTDLRFWVSGVGIVGQLPFAPRQTLNWSPGERAVGGATYRVQPLAHGVPVAPFSPPTEIVAPCAADPTTSCFQLGRFRATSTWRNPYSGVSGEARAIRLSDDASLFHFGDASNVELMVKVLDFGPNFKVFFGQLTDFEFAVTITDLLTGHSQTYRNAPDGCGGIDQQGFPKLATQAGNSSDCEPGTLCLGDRFSVRVTWKSPYDVASFGDGSGSPLPGGLAGTFSFTNPSNIELLVKILDFGDRVLLLWGALSDFEYTIDVTDSRTGAVRSHHNPARRYCGGLDARAF